MYMVRSSDGQSVKVCENLPQAFSQSLTVSASGGVGSTVSVVAVEKGDHERVVGTFQRVNSDEVWCITPMFPTGTVMHVSSADEGGKVRPFANIPSRAAVTEPATEYQIQTQAAVASLRSLLGLVHRVPVFD